jgi:hypothetical protein
VQASEAEVKGIMRKRRRRRRAKSVGKEYERQYKLVFGCWWRNEFHLNAGLSIETSARGVVVRSRDKDVVVVVV